MSDDPILECPSCGARLKVKAASLRALKEMKCPKCRGMIPTSGAAPAAPAAPAKPARSVAAVPGVVAPNPDVIKVAPAPVAAPAPVTPAAAPAPAPAPVVEAPVVQAPVAVADPGLVNRVAGLEAQLAQQAVTIASLQAEIGALRQASIAAGRQWVAGLESD